MFLPILCETKEKHYIVEWQKHPSVSKLDLKKFEQIVVETKYQQLIAHNDVMEYRWDDAYDKIQLA